MSNTSASVKQLASREPTYPIAIALVIAVLILQVLFGVVVYLSHGDWPTRGQFGDMFGALNALFSGLALGGVIVAIILQSKELGLQRQEMEETRDVLSRTAVSQEKSVNVLALQVRAQMKENDRQALLFVVQLMEDVRDDRRFIRKCIDDKTMWETLRDDEIERVDRVCRAFDIVGLLERHELVDHKLVGHFYSVPLTELYDQFLGSYVRWLRDEQRRGPAHYWELVEFYKRAKKLAEIHPARTGENDSQLSSHGSANSPTA